ncbi:Alpha/Beta hydrolase protein [Talaromyces proteolyticus]|uniref:Alpha/Beta hydrolase protein n=1 Tax=Talaromyces proteolyticus TaxID=1131652 RepID=A0AAD4KWS7_9EURO|nr:Alpha/Beta hydrolase protein [Talaromyces proteolyticus]KAH8701904.1 Alpha/Beta hydrolase protein [Talaromyces proteolyticus]
MASPPQRVTRTAAVQGIKIVYDSYGFGDEALVFIHGWSCSRQLWASQSPLYETHRSILVDLPGHGDSDSPHIDYQIELFAHAVKVVVEQERVRKVVLVAHSMGGPIATMFLRLFAPCPAAAVDAPSLQNSVIIAGIVYVDSFLHLPESYMTLQQRQSLGKSLEDDDAFIAKVNRLFTSDTGETVRETVLRTMLATPKHVRARATTSKVIPHAMAYDEVYGQVPAINIVAPSCPPAHGHWFHHLPLLKIKKMTGVSHWLFLEKPEQFNMEVEGFLRDNNLLLNTN